VEIGSVLESLTLIILYSFIISGKGYFISSIAVKTYLILSSIMTSFERAAPTEPKYKCGIISFGYLSVLVYYKAYKVFTYLKILCSFFPTIALFFSASWSGAGYEALIY